MNAGTVSKRHHHPVNFNSTLSVIVRCGLAQIYSLTTVTAAWRRAVVAVKEKTNPFLDTELLSIFQA